MNHSAHKKKTILVSGVDTYLGSQLAKYFLEQNYIVYALGNSKHINNLISSPNFTLLEIDLSQPIPAYLPKFDAIFYLDLINQRHGHKFTTLQIPPQLKNLISYSQQYGSKLNVISALTQDPDFLDLIAPVDKTKEQISLILVGDVYGVDMPTNINSPEAKASELTKIISQAVSDKKIVMEKEGLAMIYPTYIDDAVIAIDKFGFSKDLSSTQYVTSEDPKTTLSLAYEIKNLFGLINNSHIELFFAGSKPQEPQHKETTLKIHLNFKPKTTFPQGFRKILESELMNSSNESGSISKIESFHKTREQAHVSSEKVVIDKLETKEKIREKLPKIKKLNLNFGRFSQRLKLKHVAIIAALLLLASGGKSALDVYLGTKALSSARDAIEMGNLEEAEHKSNSAHKSFSSASKKMNILAFPLTALGIKKAQNTLIALEAAQDGASSLKLLIEGASAQLENIAYITDKYNDSTRIDLETPLASFRRSYFLASQAKEKTSFALNSTFFKNQIKDANESFEKLEQVSQSALELTPLLFELTGSSEAKTYLVLLLNNAELRPGGGFIGNFGLISFENGKLKDIEIQDIYEIDGQLKEQIEAPVQLVQYLGVDNFYLRDSNWSPDFVLNSATARDFFKKETGKDVDGVISVDLSFIQNLLGVLGPLSLQDYEEEITADNLFERGIYHSEIGFFPGSKQKKDFFTTLSRQLITDFITSLSPQSPKASIVSLIEITLEALEQKHIMISVDSPQVASFIKTKSWDRPLPPSFYNPADDSIETRDFLSISEANISANKVNRFIERKIDYEVTVGRDADLIANLTITYTNDSQAETWPAGKYTNYLRVYVPFAVDVISHSVAEVDSIENLEITNAQNLTTLATVVEIPINSTREIKYSYKIPKNINLENAPAYSLYIQKQPGTEKDQLDFTFNLPGYIKEKETGKQNLRVVTDLEVDRKFRYQLTQ